MGEWAPPFYRVSSATPSTIYSQNKCRGSRCESFATRGDGNENHSHLERLEGAQKIPARGSYHPKPQLQGQILGKPEAKPREC